MSPREVFLSSESDAWFARNEAALRKRDWLCDPVAVKLSSLIRGGESLRILEIGSGDGARLQLAPRVYPRHPEEFHHERQQRTDDPDQWKGLVCLRKLPARR